MACSIASTGTVFHALRFSETADRFEGGIHMLRRILVGDNEGVLLIRNKRFNVKSLVFSSDWTDFIVNQRPELASRYFTVVETTALEVAVVSLDGRVARVIAP